MTETDPLVPKPRMLRALVYQAASIALLGVGVPMLGFGASLICFPDLFLFVGPMLAQVSLACLVVSGPMVGFAIHLSRTAQRIRIEDHQRQQRWNQRDNAP